MYNNILSLFVVATLVLAASVTHASTLIRNGTTVAGQNTISGFDDGDALTVAKLAGPTAVLYVASTKSVLIGDTSVIRNVTNKVVSTIFGIANQPGSVDGAKGVAKVNSPSALRQIGNKYYFTEPASNLLRCIDGDNIVTVAGTQGATSSQDGVGLAANFQQPSGLALGADGVTLYTADRGSNSIRRINTATMAVTTVVSGVLAPNDIVCIGNILYVLNRPTGDSTVGVYRYDLTTSTGAQWIAATQPFLTLGADKENARLFGATQNRIYEIYSNATIGLYAGTGSSFTNGLNPTFRSITQMYVVNYRAMYLATGASAYMIRGLFHDPPPSIGLALPISYPDVYFPVDNVTQMQLIMESIQEMINANLGVVPLPDGSPSTDVSPLATVTAYHYNATTGEVTFDVVVPNMTYTSTTAATVLDTSNYQTTLTQMITEYYDIAGYTVAGDYWTIPNGNATAMSQLKSLLQRDLRNALQYGGLNLQDPTWAETTTDATITWKILVPPSFKNSTTDAILAALKSPTWTSPSTFEMYPLTAAFLEAYYTPNVVATLGSHFVLPLNQPEIMYSIRSAVRQDIANSLSIALSTVGNYAPPPLVNSTSFKILIPRVAGISNTTIINTINTMTFTSVQSTIDAAYPNQVPIVFDGLTLPWSDPAAMNIIRSILLASMSDTFGTNLSSPEQFLLSQNISVTGPVGWQNATLLVSGLPGITTAELQNAVLVAQSNPQLQTYLNEYYTQTSGTASVTMPQVTLPVSDPNAMEILRHLIATDLALALGLNNTGVNVSSPFFTFSTTPPATGASLPNGQLGAPAGASNIVFDLLLPATGINSTTLLLIEQLIAQGLPSMTAFLTQYYNTTITSSTGESVPPSIPLPSTVPTSNATAMEELRTLLAEQLRLTLNDTLGNLSTDAILASVNVLPYDPETNSFPIQLPAFLTEPPLNLDLTALIRDTHNTFTTTTLPDYLSQYYPTPFEVKLSYDITPFSNDTTMLALYEEYLKADIRNTLKATYPQIASLTDAQLPIILALAPSPNPTVSKANSTTTWTILLPPSPFAFENATTTQEALDNTTLPLTNAFLDDYFPNNLYIVMSGNDIPVYDDSLLQQISVLLRNQLAENLGFENIGVNGTRYDAATGNVIFKVIVPPQWNTSDTELLSNLTALSDPSATDGLNDLLATVFSTDNSAIFAEGYFPVSNATAMEEIRRLLRLDAQDLFQYSPIGVAAYRNFTDPFTDQVFNIFDFKTPPSFSNGSTTAMLLNASYPRVAEFMARYATPAPPLAVFNFSVPWPIAIMPTANDTQMALLQQALLQDAIEGLGNTNISGFTYRISEDGQSVIYDILLPIELNNIETGVTLENHGWPRFQQLLASITQGNLAGTGGATGIQSVDEGCSRGCVIAVAAIGATIVTAGVIAAIVLSSKRKRLATVVASNGAHKNTEGRPPAPAFTPVFDDGTSSPAKNPLDMS